MAQDYEGGFPVLYDTQVETTSTEPVYQPGAIFTHRSGPGRKQWALVKYIQVSNDGISQGECLFTDDGRTGEWGVKKCTTTEGRQAPFRGLACATIASNNYGFMYIGGYVEKGDLSHTAASGEMLCISGSTAGKLTPDGASSVMNATLGTSTFATSVFPVAVARTAIGTGVGSCSLIGIWG